MGGRHARRMGGVESQRIGWVHRHIIIIRTLNIDQWLGLSENTTGGRGLRENSTDGRAREIIPRVGGACEGSLYNSVQTKIVADSNIRERIAASFTASSCEY